MRKNIIFWREGKVCQRNDIQDSWRPVFFLNLIVFNQFCNSCLKIKRKRDMDKIGNCLHFKFLLSFWHFFGLYYYCHVNEKGFGGVFSSEFIICLMLLNKEINSVYKLCFVFLTSWLYFFVAVMFIKIFNWLIYWLWSCCWQQIM